MRSKGGTKRMNKGTRIGSGSQDLEQKPLLGRSSSSTAALNRESESSSVPPDWNVDDSTITINPCMWYLAFRNAKIITIEPVIFLYMFGTYLYASLTQQYYYNRYALDLFIRPSDVEFVKDNGSACLNLTATDRYTGLNDTNNVVETYATHLFIYTSIPNRILSIVSTLIMGPLSDRYGRRPVIILVGVGSILQGVCAFLIVELNLNLYFFILGSALSGLFGDFAAILMACFSYVSDVSSSKWRTARIGIAESMIYMAGMISTGAGGYWFDKLNCKLALPMVLFLACNVGLIVYTIFLLPESLTKEQRKTKNSGKPRGTKALVRGFKIFFGSVDKYKGSVWKLWVAIVPIVIIVVNTTGAMSIGVFFFKAIKWGPTLLGIELSTSMGSHMIVLLVILPLLTAFLPDPIIALIGAIVNCCMNLFFGLSHKTYQIFIVAILQGLDALIVPPLRGTLSRIVSVEDQGALFSLIASTETLGTFLAGLIFPIILPITLDHNLNPGTAYVVMGAVGVIPLPFLCILLVNWCLNKRREVKEPVHGHLCEEEDDVPILSSESGQIQAVD